jgi:phosphoribosylanthranilate isomerase
VIVRLYTMHEEMVRVVRPAILHLCPLASAVTPAQVRALGARLPGIPVMQAISVTGPESVEEARAYAEVADYVILDTQAPTTTTSYRGLRPTHSPRQAPRRSGRDWRPGSGRRPGRPAAAAAWARRPS